MDEHYEHFDTEEAIKAQAEYCRNHGVPNFAPVFDGRCTRCGREIFRPITHSDGHITGITVEGAGKALITGCPHCYYSFVD